MQTNKKYLPHKIRRSLSSRLLVLAPIIGVFLLLLAACDTPQNTFVARSDSTQRIYDIYIYVIWAAALVGAFVLIGMAYILVKFRDRPGRKAQQIHGHTGLEITWTVVPILILISIAIPTVLWVVQTQDEPDANVLEITAVGKQWWFEFQYPGLGPDGSELITANELHIPVGRQVSITLESDNVIHSFWVPQLVGKTDMVPNRQNPLEKFTATEPGIYYGQCAEFCGSAHALMRFRVHVDTTGGFDRWVESMNSSTVTPAAGSVEALGKNVFEIAGGCSGCHAINGTNAVGKIGPNLTLFGERNTLGAGILDNNSKNLKQWVSNVRDLKPVPEEGSGLMPTFHRGDPNTDLLTEAQIDQVVAYLQSLKR